ncbi:DMT family transporter [Aeromicrobium sp. IC_218]|uniref:DMT family transporter n=1 Tax=Aeromicrobium sp. IC_218 TaxID=2545468 RepID=UPI00103F2198|nr:DMT family transporter [Aeromicrobium sp. IC_218]TCI95901.1 DMT family transporter [Aeromicrobium sp. IC_218]
MSRPIGISVPSGGLASAGLAVLFVVCWSSGFVGAKLGTGEAAPTTLLMWRALPAAVLLVPLAWWLERRRRARPGAGLSWRAVRVHVVVGVLSQTCYLLTVYGAIDLGVSSGTTALVDGVQPLVAAVLVGPLLGAAVSGRQWVGLALGLAGVLLVSWADFTAGAGDVPVWAYAVPLGGMLSLLASTIVERRAALATPPLTALAVHAATSAVLLTAAAVLTGTAVPPASRDFWVATAWLVVLATLGGYGLYWLLVERIGVVPVNSLMFLVAPVTSVWGAVMFGEPLTAVTVAGLALTLVAAATATGRRQEPVPA